VKVTPDVIDFVVGRAGAIAPDGHPWFNYAEIRKNLAKSKQCGVLLSRKTIRGIVRRHAPGVFIRRKGWAAGRRASRSS
jgi:hypothetical protein